MTYTSTKREDIGILWRRSKAGGDATGHASSERRIAYKNDVGSGSTSRDGTESVASGRVARHDDGVAACLTNAVGQRSGENRKLCQATDPDDEKEGFVHDSIKANKRCE